VLHQSPDPFADHVDLCLRRLDSGLGFLLEGMNDPDLIPKLDGIDRPVSVAPIWQRHLVDARAEAFHGLGDPDGSALGRHNERLKNALARADREFVDLLASALRRCASSAIVRSSPSATITEFDGPVIFDSMTACSAAYFMVEGGPLHPIP
jgi:hypothetical protein